MPGNDLSVLCIGTNINVIESLSWRSVYALLSKHVSFGGQPAGGFAPRALTGLLPWAPLGDFRPVDLLICPLMEQILRAPMQPSRPTRTYRMSIISAFPRRGGEHRTNRCQDISSAPFVLLICLSMIYPLSLSLSLSLCVWLIEIWWHLTLTFDLESYFVFSVLMQFLSCYCSIILQVKIY